VLKWAPAVTLPDAGSKFAMLVMPDAGGDKVQVVKRPRPSLSGTLSP
jgi:hypothetical protein